MLSHENMAIPPWTFELLRRGLTDVAKKATEPETIERLKHQAGELLQELPDSAAKQIDSIMRRAEAGKESIEKWAQRRSSLTTPIINASGELFHEEGTGSALATSVLETGHELLMGDIAAGMMNHRRFNQRLQKLLPSGSDKSVVITSNLSSAIASIPLLYPDRQFVTNANSPPAPIDHPCVAPIFNYMVPKLHDVNLSNPVMEDDVKSLQPCCIISTNNGTTTTKISPLDPSVARQAMILPVATFADPERFNLPSAVSMIENGIDVVALPGNGLCGGPDCGILVAPTEAINRLNTHPLWPAFSANESTKLMMLITLELEATEPELIPVRSLLETNIENLRSRAERLASRLGGNDQISSCEVTAKDATITSSGSWRIPSRQLRIRHTSKSVQSWQRALAQDSPAVLTKLDEDELSIDLRWVPPIDDSRLGEIFGGTIS